MNKFVPYDKMSKKDKRKADAAKRTRWTVDPRSKLPKYSGAYDRNKQKTLSRRESVYHYVQINTFYRREETVGYFYGFKLLQ